jgi:hypothetical protein
VTAPLADWAHGCGDAVTNTGRALVEQTKITWDNLLHGTKEDRAQKAARQEFENICEADRTLSIKRRLEQEAWLEGVSERLTDSKLSAISCAKLMREVQTRKNFAEAQSLAAKAGTPEYAVAWETERDRAWDSATQTIESLASGLSIRLACYNRQARVELQCKLAMAIAAGLVTHRLIDLKRAAGIRFPEKAAKDFDASPDVEIWSEAETPWGHYIHTQMPVKEIELGRSYTAIIVDDKLILGRDIHSATGKIGGSGTHKALLQMSRPEAPKHAPELAGAIRFNPDGSVDISGFHHKAPSAAAAEELKRFVLRVSPDAKVRMTADRLNTLRPPGQ